MIRKLLIDTLQQTLPCLLHVCKSIIWGMKLWATTIIWLIVFLLNRRAIKSLRQKHTGERCFIIGNGPSLRKEDLEKLRHEQTFAANRIYLVFDEVKWRPTYYVVIDNKVQFKYKEEIAKVDAKIKFQGISPLVGVRTRLKGFIQFWVDIKISSPMNPPFSTNLLNGIYEGGTVTYAALQLAIYMGFKEIYLLGIDFSYSSVVHMDGTISSHNVKDYFSDNYLAGKKIEEFAWLPNLERQEQAYIKARELAEQNGIKIYNATRGGKLEVFERVDFDTLKFK